MRKRFLVFCACWLLLYVSPASTQPRLFIDLSSAEVVSADTTPNPPGYPVTTLEATPGSLVRVTVGLSFEPFGTASQWYLASVLLALQSADLEVVTVDQSDITANAFWHPHVAQRSLLPQAKAAAALTSSPIRANMLQPNDTRYATFASSGATWCVLAPGGNAHREPFYIGHVYVRVRENAAVGAELPIAVSSSADPTLTLPNSLLATDGSVRYHRFGADLPGGIASIRVVTRNISITTRLLLQNYVGQLEGIPVHLEVRRLGEGNPLRQYLLSTDREGRVRWHTDLIGRHDISLKATHWLRRTLQDIELRDNLHLDVSLINGDVDGDNEVTLFDFGRLVSAFGSMPGDTNWYPDADLDGDEEVTLFDFGILVSNFGDIGDD